MVYKSSEVSESLVHALWPVLGMGGYSADLYLNSIGAVGRRRAGRMFQRTAGPVERYHLNSHGMIEPFSGSNHYMGSSALGLQCFIH